MGADAKPGTLTQLEIRAWCIQLMHELEQRGLKPSEIEYYIWGVGFSLPCPYDRLLLVFTDEGLDLCIQDRDIPVHRGDQPDIGAVARQIEWHAVLCNP